MPHVYDDVMTKCCVCKRRPDHCDNRLLHGIDDAGVTLTLAAFCRRWTCRGHRVAAGRASSMWVMVCRCKLMMIMKAEKAGLVRFVPTRPAEYGGDLCGRCAVLCADVTVTRVGLPLQSRLLSNAFPPDIIDDDDVAVGRHHR